MRSAVDPEAVPDDLAPIPHLLHEPDDPLEGPWDLFSAIAYFIASAMTEPHTNTTSRA